MRNGDTVEASTSKRRSDASNRPDPFDVTPLTLTRFSNCFRNSVAGYAGSVVGFAGCDSVELSEVVNRLLVAEPRGSFTPGLRLARKASLRSPGATSGRQLRGSERRGVGVVFGRGLRSDPRRSILVSSIDRFRFER